MTMKKGIFIALLAVVICQGAFCAEKAEKSQKTSVERLFKDFAKAEHTTHVKIGSFTMSLARVFTDTKGVSDIEVFAFEECNKQTKDELNAAIRNLKDNAYETLVSSTKNGERTKVLVKLKDDHINEIVVMTSGGSPALIRIKGKIKPDDVQSVLDNNL